jgi:hypothetical protein
MANKVKLKIRELKMSLAKKIILSAKKKILFLPHAVKQMSRPDRMISTKDVRDTIFYGEIIEEYLDDQRGESCLVFHTKDHRIIHVVCSPKTEYLAIITAYLPNIDQWSSNFRERK